MKKAGLVLSVMGALAAVAATLGVVAVSAALAAAGTGPAVTVQIKTKSKTLKDVVVHGEKGWITKDGAAKDRCSGDSGAGALDAATHGKWSGKWYGGSLDDFLVNSILGVKPKSPDFWELFVNGKSASSGICHVKLRAHETILFKIAK